MAVAAISLISLAISTTLAIEKARQKAAFQARANSNNAILAGFQKSASLQRGQAEADRIRQEGSRIKGKSLAAATVSGADAGSGSLANLLAVSAANVEADVATVRSNAARAAWGLDNEISQFRARASQARRAGALGALGAGLSGAAQAASIGASEFEKGSS